MNPDFIARLNALRQTRREMLGSQQWQGIMSSSNGSADIAGKFKEGQARQDAKTWRQKHMEAAKRSMVLVTI